MEGISHHCLPVKTESHPTNLVHPALAWLYLPTATASSSLFSPMAITWIRTLRLMQCICHLEPSIHPITHMRAMLRITLPTPTPPCFAEAPVCPGCIPGSLAPPCWMEGLDGQAKQKQSSAAFLHVSQFQSQPVFAANPGFLWL